MHLARRMQLIRNACLAAELAVGKGIDTTTGSDHQAGDFHVGLEQEARRKDRHWRQHRCDRGEDRFATRFAWASKPPNGRSRSIARRSHRTGQASPSPTKPHSSVRVRRNGPPGQTSPAADLFLGGILHTRWPLLRSTPGPSRVDTKRGATTRNASLEGRVSRSAARG